MEIKYIIQLIIYLVLFSNITFGQDTIYVEQNPQVIIKGWHPEFEDFPSLKIGENKIIYIIIPAFNNLPIRNNDIDLGNSNNQVEIKETEKLNQYLVTVKEDITDAEYINLAIWFEIGNQIILIRKGNDWINVIEYYPTKNNRILLDNIKLELKE